MATRTRRIRTVAAGLALVGGSVALVLTEPRTWPISVCVILLVMLAPDLMRAGEDTSRAALASLTDRMRLEAVESALARLGSEVGASHDAIRAVASNVDALRSELYRGVAERPPELADNLERTRDIVTWPSPRLP